MIKLPRPATFLPLAALLFAQGCATITALGDATAVLDVYELRAPEAVATGPRRPVQITVVLPTTTGALDTDRIMVKPDPLAAQYLSDARWGEEVPVMAQSLMLRTLQETGAFAYVGRDPLGLSGDVAVVADVIDFQAEADAEGPGATVRLRLRVQAVREDDATILSGRSFEARARAEDTDTRTLVRAFDAASDDLLAAFADWALVALR